MRVVEIAADSVYMYATMNEILNKLLELAKTAEPSPEHREAQRRSFAYGNAAFENDLVTREMIDREAEKLAREEDAERRDREER